MPKILPQKYCNFLHFLQKIFSVIFYIFGMTNCTIFVISGHPSSTEYKIQLHRFKAITAHYSPFILWNRSFCIVENLKCNFHIMKKSNYTFHIVENITKYFAFCENCQRFFHKILLTI